ncbi:MAG: thioredoxin family protein [bacterium]|nr:thioredoxin family protein [bacterium]
MKNPVMIVLLVVVVAVLGIGAFTLSQEPSQSDSTIPTDGMVKKDDTTMEKTDDKMLGDKLMSSRYLEYSNAAFDNASSNRRVLFFYASWCPTCRPADANFKENESKIPEDVTLFRVNYNDSETDQEEKDLAKKYAVTYQHTYVQVDGTGKEITKWNGGQLNELLTNIK